MTIGATSTFLQTRDEICTDALTNLGVVAPGKSASDARTAGLLTHAARALNRVVKAMDVEGEFLWRIERRTAVIELNDVGFDPDNDVLDIDEPMAFYSVDAPLGEDRRQLVSMSRDEYMVLRRNSNGIPPDVGIPSRYFVEHQQSVASAGDTTIAVWFDRQINTDGTLEYAAFIRSADFTSGATTPNFPSKWTACLVYGLTAELAGAYRQPAMLTTYRQLFVDEKARLLANDNERGNLTLVPFGGVY